MPFSPAVMEGSWAPPEEPAHRAGEIDRLRAAEYALLARLLFVAPSADMLAQLCVLQGDDKPLGRAHAALAEAARAAQPRDIEREFFDLFIGVGRGELLPYASYYLTGFLYERPLAELRADLDALGIERAPDQVEPEDHVATLCEVMAGLAAGIFPADPQEQCRFFERHLRRWMPRFFRDLERSERARFYRAVGAFGSVLMRIEGKAFAMQ